MNEPFVTLFSLRLCGFADYIRQWWIGGEPEPNEQRQRFVADFDGMLQVPHLANDPIKTASKCSLHSLWSIG
ncbi:MAG: hypothetical protein APF78_08660 [Sphingomonadales bacterium BRH_c3]|nr:MAG: hypothetical protein APF78_08660 [Sphingomonadales bacterium BRH_c3]